MAPVCLYSPASIPFAGAKFTGYEQGKKLPAQFDFREWPTSHLAEGIILVKG
jgi:hypothetical protein